MSRISGFRHTANRRRHYHRMPTWAAGYLITGDAATSLNPIYAHGMTVAAHSALAIREHLHTCGTARDFHALQRAIQRTANLPWLISTSTDIRYPHARGPRPTLSTVLLHHALDRFLATAVDTAAVADAFIDLFTLSAPPSRVLRPNILAALFRGSRDSSRATTGRDGPNHPEPGTTP